MSSIASCKINKKDWNYSSIRDQVLLVEDIPNNQLWLLVETLLKMGIVWVWAPCQDASGKWRWIQVGLWQDKSKDLKDPRALVAKKEVILELRGLWNCLKFLTGHPPSIICSSPNRTPFLLVMAQEHPIFGQQFFLRGKNKKWKTCFRWKANDRTYFGDRNLWRICVAVSWRCPKSISDLWRRSSGTLGRFLQRSRRLATELLRSRWAPWAGVEVEILSAANWCWCDPCLALCFTVMSHESWVVFFWLLTKCLQLNPCHSTFLERRRWSWF